MPAAIRTVAWREDRALLATRVSGVLRLEDVAAWKADLYEAGRRIPADRAFKMLIDIRGYEVADQDPAVHQAMREVTPLFLAAHGFPVGFFRLYEVEPPAGSGETAARCRAVAHVHHDCGKMDRYNELLATAGERFFCDLDRAAAWLDEAPTGGPLR